MTQNDRMIWDTPFQPFETAVTGCEPRGKRWGVTLEDTLFYPEGGGQPGDRGTLGGAALLDTVAEGGRVVHVTDAPLAVGARVRCALDAGFRADVSRQHTGEHTLSGTLHRLYGADNVGFHIGESFSTMDTSIPLSAQQLQVAEDEANRVVMQNEEVRVFYPSPEERAALEYRSKKELSGLVRLVSVPGADLCACCGTHVRRTGEIGLIYIASAIHYKVGTRLTLLCGARAQSAARRVREAAREAGALLSAPPEGVADAVKKALDTQAALRARLAAFERAACARHLEAARAGSFMPYVFCDPLLDAASLKRACLSIASEGAAALGFAPDGNGACVCAAGAGAVGAGEAVRALCARFGGRGGGNDAAAQGRIERGGEAEWLSAAREEYRIT